MEIDVTGGSDASRDFILPERPERPALRESVSMWISDDQGRFGFPRFCIEAVGSQWTNRGIQANIAFPDGRVLIGAGGFEGAPPKLVDGQATTLSAGPLTFERLEPLRRWKMTFDGDTYETTVRRQTEGEITGPRRRVTIEVDAVMAAPPWLPGAATTQDKVEANATSLAIGGVGGERHEQLFRCKGRFRIEGEPELSFEGTGLRIHRIGVRDVGDFPGHCWQSALFPSGKAFGIVAFPPRSDGSLAYSEGFVFDGRRMLVAKVVEAPWMTKFVPNGGPADVVLETEAGRIRIAGRTHDSTYVRQGRSLFGDWAFEGAIPNVGLPFHQGGAHYAWDGESAYGMIERSYPADKVQP